MADSPRIYPEPDRIRVNDEGEHYIRRCPGCGKDHLIHYERGATGIPTPFYYCEEADDDE